MNPATGSIPTQDRHRAVNCVHCGHAIVQGADGRWRHRVSLGFLCGPWARTFATPPEEAP